MQVAVVRTLRAHGRSYPASTPRGAVGRRRRRPARAAARSGGAACRSGSCCSRCASTRPCSGRCAGVPNDVLRVVLLARSLDRQLTGAPSGSRSGWATRRWRSGGPSTPPRRAWTSGCSGRGSRTRCREARGLGQAAVAYARRRFTARGRDRGPPRPGGVRGRRPGHRGAAPARGRAGAAGVRHRGRAAAHRAGRAEVGDTGLEPVTSSVSRKRATRLRQSPELCSCGLRPARPGRESNPRTGICSPLPKPLGHPAGAGAAPARRLPAPVPSGRRDSNPRPSPWQGDALPLSHVRVQQWLGEPLCRAER